MLYTRRDFGNIALASGVTTRLRAAKPRRRSRKSCKTLKKNKYKFPASIEYEYNTPEGSDVLTEVKKCVQFCKDALA